MTEATMSEHFMSAHAGVVWDLAGSLGLGQGESRDDFVCRATTGGLHSPGPSEPKRISVGAAGTAVTIGLDGDEPRVVGGGEGTEFGRILGMMHSAWMTSIADGASIVEIVVGYQMEALSDPGFSVAGDDGDPAEGTSFLVLGAATAARLADAEYGMLPISDGTIEEPEFEMAGMEDDHATGVSPAS